MKAIFLMSAWLIVSSSSAASEPTASACGADSFRQFDFWLGEWIVKEASGKFAGENSIESRHEGCVLIEEWRSASGGHGTSINYFDPATVRWKQIWVSPGVLLEMSGGMRGNEMILEGPLQDLSENKVSLLRGIWTPLPDGRVRQHFTESKDGGKTWAEWFDGYYERSKR